MSHPRTLHSTSKFIQISLGLMAGLAALLVMDSAVRAQTPQAVTDDDVNRIASQLYCPVCQNVTLDVCPTTACDQWRAAIRSKLEAGWSDQSIEDYFVEQFGARVIGTPPRSGFNWLLYAVPPLGAVGLAIAAFFVLHRKPGRVSQPQQPLDIQANGPQALREKLERDVHKDDPA